MRGRAELDFWHGDGASELLAERGDARIGYAAGWTGGQLKVTQEAIALAAFGVFMVTVLGEPLGWRHLGAFLCLVGAVAFLFAGK